MGGENQEETRASESTRSVGSVLSVHFEIGVLSIFDGDQTRLLSNSAFERAASSTIVPHYFAFSQVSAKS